MLRYFIITVLTFWAFRFIYAMIIVVIVDRKVYDRFVELSNQVRTADEANKLFALTSDYYEAKGFFMNILDLTKWTQKGICCDKQVYEELFEKSFYAE